ncbi:MAG: tetratricopeptide repeat protein [Ectobacillus sp.]
MNFQPQADDKIKLFGRTYKFAKHPAVAGIDIPYGQEGRQGVVYQIYSEHDVKAALKIFRSRFQQTEAAEKKPFSAQYVLPGLHVWERLYITKANHRELLSLHDDLSYAVVMPWIDGPTWADILLEQRPLTKEQCACLAGSLAYLLMIFEEKELAHCDLSASNLLLPYLEESFFYPVELVDIEQMYGPQFEKPNALPGGTKGYAPRYVQEGIWSRYGDRFSGTVLLAELLGWPDEQVRGRKGTDMSYFDEADMQQDGERYRTLHKALERNWGRGIASLLERAWNSNSLEECPSFREWWEALPEDIKESSKAQYEACTRTMKPQLPENGHVFSAEDHMKAAFLLEKAGNRAAALREYIHVYEHSQTAALREDLQGIIKSLEASIGRVSPQLRLEDYADAALGFEKTEEFEHALFLYEHASKLHCTDEAALQELEIIARQVRTQQAQKEQAAKINALETAKQKAEKPRYMKREKRPSPFAKQQEGRKLPYLKWFVRISIGAGIAIIIYAGYEQLVQYRYKMALAEGTAAYETTHYIQAEKSFEKALAIKETEEAHAKLATVYIILEEYQKAFEYISGLKESGKIKKSNSTASYLLGRALFGMERYHEAIPHYEEALKNKDKKLGEYEKPALRDLAVSYANMRNMKKAQAVLSRIEANEPAEKALIQAIQADIYMIQGNYTEAISQYKEASANDKTVLRYRTGLARAYVSANRTGLDPASKEMNFKEAVNLLSEIRNTDPTKSSILLDLASVYYEFGSFYETQGNKEQSDVMYKSALEGFQEAQKIGVADNALSLNIAVLNSKLGKIPEAEKGFEEVLQANPRDGHAMLLYGLFLIQQSQYDRAYSYLQQVEGNTADEADINIAKKQIEDLKAKGWVR